MRPVDKSDITWDAIQFAGNSLLSRMKVCDYLLNNYSRILKCTEGKLSGDNKRLFSALYEYYLNRPRVLDRLPENYIQQMNQWKDVRVEGNLWFYGYESGGARFVSLGKSEEEESVYIVKGLATKFTTMMGGMPSHGMPGHCFLTVLLPYKDKITYFASMMVSTTYPKEHMELFGRLQGVVERCRAVGRVYTSMNAACAKIGERKTRDDISDLSVSEGDDRSNVYIPHLFPRSLLREGRVGGSVGGVQLPSTMSNKTSLTEQMGVWSPTNQDVTRGRETNWDKYFLAPKKIPLPPNEIKNIVEGFKTVAQAEFDLPDSHRCILCHSGKQFASCCKSVHLKRVQESIGSKNKNGVLLYNRDPMSEEQCSRYSTLARSGENPNTYSVATFLELEYVLESSTELDELRNRMFATSPFFKPTTFNTFNVLGFMPSLEPRLGGILYFATIEFAPAKNSFTIHANSQTRLEFMIKEMTDMIEDLHVVSTTTNATKNYGGSDKSSLKQGLRNTEAAIRKELGSKVETASSLSSSRGHDMRCCGFCGLSAAKAGKLLVCSRCKKEYYCSANCQKSHWRLHKQTCGTA